MTYEKWPPICSVTSVQYDGTDMCPIIYMANTLLLFWAREFLTMYVKCKKLSWEKKWAFTSVLGNSTIFYSDFVFSWKPIVFSHVSAGCCINFKFLVLSVSSSSRNLHICFIPPSILGCAWKEKVTCTLLVVGSSVANKRSSARTSAPVNRFRSVLFPALVYPTYIRSYRISFCKFREFQISTRHAFKWQLTKDTTGIGTETRRLRYCLRCFRTDSNSFFRTPICG